MIRRELRPVLRIAALLCAWSLMSPQSHAQDTTPLVLKGYDPVAYFTAGKPTPGKPNLETVFDEARYRFSSQENMQTFETAPDKYVPQFAGACTYGMSKGVKLEANPEVWRIVDGKLFVFSGVKVPDEMDANPRGVIAEARKNWNTLRDKPH